MTRGELAGEINRVVARAGRDAVRRNSERISDREVSTWDSPGALAAGADRLGCQCGSADCAASGRRADPVVIHVIADQATLEGAAQHRQPCSKPTG